MPLFQPLARQLKYMYWLSLCYHVCSRHTGDPTLHAAYNNQPTMASQNQQQDPATATVRLPDFYADSPQSWFDCIDAMFAAAKIMQPLTSSTGRWQNSRFS